MTKTAINKLITYYKNYLHKHYIIISLKKVYAQKGTE